MSARQPDLECVEPKPRRRMRKPLKATLYQLVDHQAAEIERLRIDRDRLAAENETLRARRSWLTRYLWSKR
jgi:hypothetical protein